MNLLTFIFISKDYLFYCGQRELPSGWLDVLSIGHSVAFHSWWSFPACVQIAQFYGVNNYPRTLIMISYFQLPLYFFFHIGFSSILRKKYSIKQQPINRLRTMIFDYGVVCQITSLLTADLDCATRNEEASMSIPGQSIIFNFTWELILHLLNDVADHNILIY